MQRGALLSAGGEMSVFGGNAGTRCCCKRERRDSDDTAARVTRYLGRLRGAVECTSSLSQSRNGERWSNAGSIGRSGWLWGLSKLGRAGFAGAVGMCVARGAALLGWARGSVGSASEMAGPAARDDSDEGHRQLRQRSRETEKSRGPSSRLSGRAEDARAADGSELAGCEDDESSAGALAFHAFWPGTWVRGRTGGGCVGAGVGCSRVADGESGRRGPGGCSSILGWLLGFKGDQLKRQHQAHKQQEQQQHLVPRAKAAKEQRG